MLDNDFSDKKAFQDFKQLFLIGFAIFLIILSFFINDWESDQADAIISLPVSNGDLGASKNLTNSGNKNHILPELYGVDQDEYIIRLGDTITSLRKTLIPDDAIFYALLEADSEDLALDNIKPGQKLILSYEEGRLSSITLEVSLSRKIVYTLIPSATKQFKAEWVTIPGVWRKDHITFNIEATFAGSAKVAGLSSKETFFIQQLLKNKLNFRREIRQGNKFTILVERNYINQQATGEFKIHAINFELSKRVIEVYFFNNHFYDEKGNSVESLFNKNPFEGSYRITSHFNLSRKHPVTGRTKAHYGTDFFMPVGSKITSPADGVVSKVVRHQYAGLYIEINHGPKYKTRYLHLSKAFVKKGQKVTRNQLIALSGKSGRVTGAHLHYELHVNGKAVDVVKTLHKQAIHLSVQDRASFLKQKAKLKNELFIQVKS